MGQNLHANMEGFRRAGHIYRSHMTLLAYGFCPCVARSNEISAAVLTT